MKITRPAMAKNISNATIKNRARTIGATGMLPFSIFALDLDKSYDWL
jgi:hypothetical protein